MSKSFFQEWHYQYANIPKIPIIKYLPKKEFKLLNKLGIKITDKYYTVREFDIINEYLFIYYKTNYQDKIIQSESLKKVNISTNDYENILSIFNKISKDYNL